MEKYELQKLRDLPIEGVAERLGMKVVRHKALCPFHDDHRPSLTFKKNKFRCWSCGENGDTISLVERVLCKDFLDACHWLANENNVIVESVERRDESGQSSKFNVQCSKFEASRYERYFERPFLNVEARRFLFTERRIDPRVVRWCRLTSWKDKRGVPWLQIPYYDREGRLVGVQNRNLVRDGLPRFRFPQGSECGIYNLPVLNLLRPGDELWITEGCSDCWAMLSAGHKAIAIPSATLLTRKDKELLKSLSPDPSPVGRGEIKASPHSHSETEKNLSIINYPLSITFHMYPDRDAPGERLFMQLQQVLPSLVHHQLPEGFKDFGEYWYGRLSPDPSL